MTTSIPHLSRVLAVVTALALVLGACSGAAKSVHEAAPKPSPSPSPSPSPVPSLPPAPLTGEGVEEEVLARPALVVKIENTAKARPQAGLETADIVFEELVEGGTTRFFAVFQSEVPVQVGPIRSARLVDATLLPAFNGIFLYSGGRDDVEAAIGGTALRLTEGAAGVYRQSGRSAPSNLFADGPAVYETALSRDAELQPPPPWFTFDETAAEGDAPGDAIDISMSSQVTTGWQYDADQGGYLRSQGGTEQTTVSGQPVVAANVVVLGVGTFRGGCCDTAGSPYVVTQTVDTGRAIVLRDGEWFEAEWSRSGEAAPVQLTRGNVPLALAPGPTWIHLAPTERLPAAPTDSDG